MPENNLVLPQGPPALNPESRPQQVPTHSLVEPLEHTITVNRGPSSAAPPTSAKLEAVAVGTKLGPYELVRKLGEGGMGAVYEARHSKLNKTFALKLLPAGFAASPGALTRFEREMQAIGQLDHPHIIKATDAGEWNGTHILVMEYVEGTDLSVLVKTRGPLSVRNACKAIRQAAMGLQHAHEHGLVHRDIKPSNLFVTKSGQIKLLDLGLARLGNDGEHQRGLTMVGQVLGTPDYMAPEQWDDTHSVDARADLYSLGCTLCFVLTGRAPYADVTKSSLMLLLKAHVEGAIPNVTDIRLDVPPELNAIVVRLLAKQAEDRYPNAAEVIAALEPFTRKAADGSTLTAKPLFAPGKEPPTAHAVPSTSEGQADRDSERSGQRSIKSLSASSTDDAFASDRPMIHGDSLASFAETIIQPRAAKRSHRRWPMIIGLSGLGLALLIGFAISSRPKGDSDKKSATIEMPSVASIAKPKEKPRPVWDGWQEDAPAPAIAPFDADQAKQHQEEWAKHVGLPVEYINTLGMKFVLIPPGEFLMGATSKEVDEMRKMFPKDDPWFGEFIESVDSMTPQHRVILTSPFYLGRHEVTQKQFLNITGSNPSAFKGESASKVLNQASTGTDDYPVERVASLKAAEFCAKLSKAENHTPVYLAGDEAMTLLDGTGYRLPTEAEWVWACYLGDEQRFRSYAAQEVISRTGWFSDNADGHPHPVGQRDANPYGLFDVFGNVCEWCQDRWDTKYFLEFAEKPAINPTGSRSGNSRRTIQGGGWLNPVQGCRGPLRFSSGGNVHVGFRVAISTDAVKAAIAKTSAKAATTGTTP